MNPLIIVSITYDYFVKLQQITTLHCENRNMLDKGLLILPQNTIGVSKAKSELMSTLDNWTVAQINYWTKTCRHF